MSKTGSLFSRKQAILLVDDDAEILCILKEWLEAQEYRVVISPSVQDAMVKLERERFACVVLDVHLAHASGEKVVQRMREEKSPHRMTPVLIISGGVEVDLLQRLKSQVQGILVKPFGPQILYDRLKLALEEAVNPPDGLRRLENRPQS